MMVSKCSSARIRKMSSTGMAAAPVTARRSEEKSVAPKSGWLRIVWYSVGVPGSMVMRSASIRRITSGTSKISWG